MDTCTAHCPAQYTHDMGFMLPATAAPAAGGRLSPGRLLPSVPRLAPGISPAGRTLAHRTKAQDEASSNLQIMTTRPSLQITPIIMSSSSAVSPSPCLNSGKPCTGRTVYRRHSSSGPPRSSSRQHAGKEPGYVYTASPPLHNNHTHAHVL